MIKVVKIGELSFELDIPAGYYFDESASYTLENRQLLEEKGYALFFLPKKWFNFWGKTLQPIKGKLIK
ncbi:MAG: hypothetical protein AABY22_30165 [Nanoarchaeota archaeon]